MVQKVVGVIPARKGSKRIKDKNLTTLVDMTLLEYTIKAASYSSLNTATIISTDYKWDEIAGYVKDIHKFQYVERVKEYCNDNVSALSAVDDLFEKKIITQDDIIVLLQPTSPLRFFKDIDEALLKFFMSDKDVLLSFSKSDPVKKLYYINEDNIKKVTDDKTVYSSQEETQTYVRNSSIYIFKASVYLEDKSIYKRDFIPFIMPKFRSIDIDDHEDFVIAEALAMGSLKVFGDGKDEK